MGFLQFRTTMQEFSDVSSSVETLFGMALGTLPANFTADFRFTLFVLTFNFSVFFILLNVLLAIIVPTPRNKSPHLLALAGLNDSNTCVGCTGISDIYF